MWIAEPRYGQLSIFCVTQSAKRIESAEDILREIFGALVRCPSTLAALGQLWSHLKTGAVLQPALTGFLQLRYRWFTKGIASSTTSTRSTVTSAGTIIPAFLLLTRLLILTSYFITFRSLWSPTTFPRFLIISCVTNRISRFIKKIKIIISIFIHTFFCSVLKSS